MTQGGWIIQEERQTEKLHHAFMLCKFRSVLFGNGILGIFNTMANIIYGSAQQYQKHAEEMQAHKRI